MDLIVRFLALQDALFDHVTHDHVVCETITRLHAEAGIDEVAPCHYFTSTQELEMHISYGLPVNDDTAACRDLLLRSVRTNLTRLAERCIAETYPLVYSADIAQPSCVELDAHGVATLAKWSKRLVAIDRYTLLGRNPSALAVVCYPPVLETLVDVGKTIDKALKGQLRKATKEADVFVQWYQLLMNETNTD